MINLFTVAAPHRSGTQWFSKVFTSEKSHCHHELSLAIHPHPINETVDETTDGSCGNHDFEQAQRRFILQAYPQYFVRHWDRAVYGIEAVGNSDGFLLGHLPGLHLLWPDMKYVFSVRNGIQVAHSHFGHRDAMPPTMMDCFRRRYLSDDFFIIACRWWTDQILALEDSRAWLRSRGAKVLDTRLETITSDIGELRRVWDWLRIPFWDKHEARNVQLIDTPVNARTNRDGKVGPESVWDKWTPTQRDVFTQECGSAMSRCGYALPDGRAVPTERSVSWPGRPRPRLPADAAITGEALASSAEQGDVSGMRRQIADLGRELKISRDRIRELLQSRWRRCGRALGLAGRTAWEQEFADGRS